MKGKFYAVSLVLLTMMLALASCSSSDSDDEGKPNDGGSTTPEAPVVTEITYEMNPAAIMVPETTAKQISNVDTISHHLTLPTSAAKPEIGQTLVINTPSDALPEGLLAKVTAVSETKSGYMITYENADLKDAFKDICIPEQRISLGDYIQHVYDADGNEIPFSRVQTTRASGETGYKIEVPLIGLPIYKDVELTPLLTLDLIIRYAMQFGDYELSYAGMSMDIDATVGAELSAKLKEGKLAEKSWRLMQLTFAPITVGPVVLTPAVAIELVVKVDGKITLQASLTYERTMHINMRYQKSEGLFGNCEIEPEASDALKFKFGPKFEGGIGFGPRTMVWLGVYGQCLCVRGTVDFLLKNTISGQFDLVEFTSDTDELFTPFKLDKDGYPEANKAFIESITDAQKWDFLKFDGIKYNMSLATEGDIRLISLGKTLGKCDLPGISVPVYSLNVMPQVLIDDDDFISMKDNDITLKLHHTKKSVLDGFTEFRVEFVPNSADESANKANTIVKYFNFDEIRGLLSPDKESGDIISTANATLNGVDSYNIRVYMNILDEDIIIFKSESKAVVNNDVKNIDFTSTITCIDETGQESVGIYYKDVMWYIRSNACPTYFRANESDIQVTPIGDKGSFRCTAKREWEGDIDYGSKHEKAKSTISFTIEPPVNGSYGKATNLEYNCEYEITYNTFGYTAKGSNTIKGTDIPVSKTGKKYTVWKGTATEGAKLSSFSHSCVVTDQNGNVKMNVNYDKADSYELELNIGFN